MTSTKAPMTADDVKAAIERFHGCDVGSDAWVCLREALSGAGGGIDVLAIGVWQSARVPGLPGCGTQARVDARWPVVAYEVKVSRADFRRELVGYQPGEAARYRSRAVPPWPGKARPALERSHYFLFAVPAGLLTAAELGRRCAPADGRGLWVPEEAGLLEVAEAGRCAVRVAPPKRAPRPLTRAETALLLRQGVAPTRERSLRREVAALQAQLERVKAARTSAGGA